MKVLVITNTVTLILLIIVIITRLNLQHKYDEVVIEAASCKMAMYDLMTLNADLTAKGK